MQRTVKSASRARRRIAAMKTLRIFVAALAAAFAAASLADPANGMAVTAIVGAKVVHPERDGPAAVAYETVLVAADRIIAVGPPATTAIPPRARVINATGKWLIPGMIDSHVHFFQSGNLYTRPDAA